MRLLLTLIGAGLVAVGGASARAGFDINGYIVGTWRNVDNQHLYVISRAADHYEFRAGATWTTSEGCQIPSGLRLYVLIPEQQTGGYLNGGEYHGDWSYVKKDEKGACVTVAVPHGKQPGYWEDSTGFVPFTDAKTAENPDGQYLKWFCAYQHAYTQCGVLSRVGKGFFDAKPQPKPVPKPTPRPREQAFYEFSWSVSVNAEATETSAGVFPGYVASRVAGSGRISVSPNGAAGTIVVSHGFATLPDYKTTLQVTGFELGLGELAYGRGGPGSAIHLKAKVVRSTFSGCKPGASARVTLVHGHLRGRLRDLASFLYCRDRFVFMDRKPDGGDRVIVRFRRTGGTG